VSLTSGPATLRVAAPPSLPRYTVALMEQPGELVGRALVVVVDDRTAHGEEDHSGPLVTELLGEAGFVVDGVVVVSSDEVETRNALNTAVIGGVDLVVSVGGTGVTPRDVTPEATLAIADKVMPGFGEQMRALSLKFVPTAILSRQVAVIRKQALVINLPGQPKSIRETLQGLPDAPGIFAAVPYCIDLIGGPYIETNEAVVKAFRPKTALRKK